MTRASASRRFARINRLSDGIAQYFKRSEQPLTILLFLLPMLALYEIGTQRLATDLARQTQTRILAFAMLHQFMEFFGAYGQYLPALAVAGILMAWHAGTAMTMAVESILLAAPVLLISRSVERLLPLFQVAQGWHGGMVLAIGAGIYEELVFRLMGFTLLNIVLVDLLRINKRVAMGLMLVITSLLFAAYHHWSVQAPPFQWSDFAFRTASGLYFGILFLARGFGITAGVHAAYDIYYFLVPVLVWR
jgi:Type II CAAX prenyl endopeptidase Rce1-like